MRGELRRQGAYAALGKAGRAQPATGGLRSKSVVQNNPEAKWLLAAALWGILYLCFFPTLATIAQMGK